MHEPAPMGELLINKEIWDGLPEDMQEIIKVAALDTATRWFVWFHRNNAEAYQELTQKHGVQVYKTPDDIMLTLLQSWDKIAAEEAAKDPFFKKVMESQREYASLIVPYRLSTWPPYSFAGNYYWKDCRVRQDAGVIAKHLPTAWWWEEMWMEAPRRQGPAALIERTVGRLRSR